MSRVGKVGWPWLAVCLGMPGWAAADMRICTFVSECFETEACSDTAFVVGVAPAQGGGDAPSVVMSSDAGDVILTGVVSDPASGAAGPLMAVAHTTPDAQHILTVSAQGAARYSVHYTDGPMMISYLGQCEVAQ